MYGMKNPRHNCAILSPQKWCKDKTKKCPWSTPFVTMPPHKRIGNRQIAFAKRRDKLFTSNL